MELVADEEAFHQSFHYDLLVRLNDQESISLSYCHDQGIPWAMRGARRWTERDVLRVNDVVLRVDEVLGCIEFDSNDTSAMQNLVNIAILREALQRETAPVSQDDLQQAMDTFRRQRGLHSAVETHTWLAERGISHEQLEGIVFQQTAASRFRSRVVAQDVEPYFEEHRDEFDTVVVALISYRDEQSAREDIDRIRQGEIDFYATAEQNVLRGSEHCSLGTTVPTTIGRLQRKSLSPEVSTTLFSAAANELVGPIRLAPGWAVVRLLEITPATLDDPTRRTIEDILFERWLTEQRAKAQVEWYWGNTRQTGDPSDMASSPNS